MNEPVEKRGKRWTEEIEIAAGDLVATVRNLVAEGNIRRLIIKNTEDRSLLEIPLTAGVVIGSTLVLLAPVLAALGALAALLSKVKIVIVRDRED
ncbi:MAG: DUF4342 domain-containing protein [Gammaproteobacteria bacterium]|jgi:hypothetical protein